MAVERGVERSETCGNGRMAVALGYNNRLVALPYEIFTVFEKHIRRNEKMKESRK